MSELTMTQSNTEKFNAFKRDIAKNKLFCKEMNLTDLKIVSDEFVEVGGVTLPLEKTAFKDLVRILGLNKKILSNFEEYMNEQAKLALLKAMQNGLANAGKRTVYLYASEQEKSVVRILNKKRPGLSDGAYLDVVERALNDNPNLVINSFAADHRGLHMNLLNESQIIDIQGMSDESFHFGLAIDNDFNKGTVVSPFNERLVCTNGMVTRVNAGAFSMKHFTSEEYNKFFEHMDALRKNEYVASGFFQNVKKAAATPASMAELEMARSWIAGPAGNDADLWLSTEYANSRYKAAGVDLETVSKEQLATAQSDKSVWDVVNAVTDFASHQHNYNISDFRRNSMKARAGELLFKGEFDMNNIMNVNPFAN